MSAPVLPMSLEDLQTSGKQEHKFARKIKLYDLLVISTLLYGT